MIRSIRAALLILLAAGCAAQPQATPVTTLAPQPDGFALYRQHDYLAASIAFHRLSADSSAEAYLAEADCERHLQNPTGEFDALKQAVRLHPKHVPAWIALAQFEQRCGRLDHADLALQRAIAVDPDSRDAWCERGLLRLRQHQADEAMACFTRAAGTTNPTDVATVSP